MIKGRTYFVKRQFMGLAFISPWLLGFLLLTLYPFAATFYWSFCEFNLLGSPRYIGTENYQRIAQELKAGTGFGQALGNTCYYAALAVPGTVLLGLLLAVILEQPTPIRPAARLLVFLPAIVPTVATSILWMWMFDPRRGFINRVLAVTGTRPTWLNNPDGLFSFTTLTQKTFHPGAKDALVIMTLWAIGNTVVIFLAALGNVRRDLLEAAELEGAGAWSRFRHVTLPQLGPVILFNTVIGLIAATQYFTQAYVVSGGTGGPANSTQVLSLYIFLWAFKYTETGYASACAWLLFAVVLILTAGLFRLSRRWVQYE